jgi:hypothetical protein
MSYPRRGGRRPRLNGRAGAGPRPTFTPIAAAPPGRRGRPAARAYPAAAVAAGYLVLAVVVTARLWSAPARLEVAGNPHDADQFGWWLTWTLHWLSTGRDPFVTSAMNAPFGINVMWNTGILLPAVVLSPLTLLGGAQLSATVLLTASFAGAAWAAWWLLRRYVTTGWPAVAGGALYGFSPAMVHAGIGHLDLVCTPLLPLIVAAGLDLLTGRGRPLAAGGRLGLFAVGQIFVNEELLYDTALGLVLVGIVLALSRPRRVPERLTAVAAGLGAALAVAAALAGYPLAVQLAGPHAQHGSPFTVSFFTADLTGLVVPSARMLVYTAGSAAQAASYRGGAPESLAYLGIPLLAGVAAAALAGWRRLAVRVGAVLTGALIVLSLGAHLFVANHDTGVPLPWALLAHLPLAADVLPARFGLLVPLAAAAALAGGADALRARAGPVPAGLLAAACLVPLLPRPLPVAPVPATPPALAAAQAVVPDGATVLYVPVPTANETVPLRWQVAAGLRFRIVGGYFIGPAPGGQAYVDGPGPGPLTGLLVDVQGGAAPARPAAAERARLAADLARLRIGTVLLGPGPREPALRRQLVLLFGPPTRARDDVAVWADPTLAR